MAYGRRSNYRRRLGYGGGVVAPFGRPLYPVPFTRKRKAPPAAGAQPRMGRRVRARTAIRAGTKTFTRRKKKLYGNAVKVGDNNSFSSTHCGSAFRSHIHSVLAKKIAGRQTVFSNIAGRFTTGQGVQSVDWFAAMNTADLNNIKTTVEGGATENDIKFYMHYVKSRTTIKNQSEQSGKVLIYDIKCIRTPPGSSVDDPKECWNKGYTDMGITTSSTVIGNTPFASPEFRRYYKVLKVTSVAMEPGQQHEHTFIHKVNQLITSTRFANQVGEYVGGLSTFQMIVANGTLVYDTTAPTAVTYCAMTWNHARSLEYSFSRIEHNAPSYSLTNTMPTTITTANLRLVGEDQDNAMAPA